MSHFKNSLFSGITTALITPFRNGEIDAEALQNLIERQIDGGTDAILVAGTTGESSTLSFSEHGKLISMAKKMIRGRIPLLAGCGSNCTERAVELAKIADRAGADGLLAVTPYYNKTSDRGIVLHYSAIAQATSKPLFLYSVPSRTGFKLTQKHYRELVKIPNIAGVKEASGDLELFKTLLEDCGDVWKIDTGNDDQALEAFKLGADGVVSVYSNVFPEQMKQLFTLYRNGFLSDAEIRMGEMLPKIKLLFREVNPIPVKYVLARKGLCQLNYRLPLCPPSPEVCTELDKI